MPDYYRWQLEYSHSASESVSNFLLRSSRDPIRPHQGYTSLVIWGLWSYLLILSDCTQILMYPWWRRPESNRGPGNLSVFINNWLFNIIILGLNVNQKWLLFYGASERCRRDFSNMFVNPKKVFLVSMVVVNDMHVFCAEVPLKVPDVTLNRLVHFFDFVIR